MATRGELKRPAKDETDEELLRLQDEFLRSSTSKPSASFTSNQTGSEQKRAKAAKSEDKEDALSSPNGLLIDNHDLNLPVVLKDIVECDFSAINVPSLQPIKQAPFPKARHRSDEVSASSSGRGPRKSLFALEMERRGKRKTGMKKDDQRKLPAEIEVDKIDKGSAVVDGTGLGSDAEALKIHEENMAKLSQMSKQEIEEARKQILEKLDPKVIEFLKSKKRTKGPAEETDVGGATVACTEVKDDADLEKKEEKMDEDVPSLEETGINKKELPIDPEEVAKYPNMDKIEPQKLAWMTMLPKPKPIDPKTGYPARFDFDGNIVSRSDDIPTQMGLHHHGDEPEVPGYTVEELFTLSRSSLPSQRVLALQTLAHIMKKHWEGLLDECLSAPLLPQLLDAGVVPLFRIALDDNAESNVAAAVLAIRNLLVCDADEVCLDAVFSWHRGCVSPFLRSSEGDTLDKDTKVCELTDAQLVKLDVVKGFLRMDLLPRLRYILEVMCPEAAVVGHILDILIRIARHSLEAATQVMNCSRLMATIFSNFLPLQWNVVDVIKGKMATVYGTPLWLAVKLTRVLATAGRHLAARMISEFHLMDPLICYLTTNPSDSKMPAPDHLKLSIEALRTWTILLGYGLASGEFVDLFPVLVNHLQFCATLGLNLDVQKHVYDYDYAACLLHAFSNALHVAASEREIVALNRSRVRQSCDIQRQTGGAEIALPPLKWSHIAGCIEVIEQCLKRWLHEAANDTPNRSGLTLLSSCMDFMASYFKLACDEPSANVVQVISHVVALYDGPLLSLISSEIFQKLLASAKDFSLLLSSCKSGTDRDSPTLPSLGSISWGGDVVPVLRADTPFPLLCSLSHLLLVMTNVNPGLRQKVGDLEMAHVAEFLSEVTSRRHHKKLSRNWFSRFEVAYLANTVLLATDKAHGFVHRVALKLLFDIPSGDEHVLHQLMSCVVFNADVLRSNEDVGVLMSRLDLDDPVVLRSPTGEVTALIQHKFFSEAMDALPAIRSMYLSHLPDATRSKNWFEGRGYAIDTFSTYMDTSSALTEDWTFIPILKLRENKKSQGEEEASTETMSLVRKCLQWAYLLHLLDPSAFDGLHPALRFCHLCTVFLARSNLFLDSGIRCYLTALLRHLVKSYAAQKWKFRKIKFNHQGAATTFSELYSELLDQFEAVSYGDTLFANAILIPLQRCFDVAFRKLLFSEHISALRILNVPQNELLVPIDAFLQPVEDDQEMLSHYCKSLVAGKLQKRWSPVMYLIAIHHLHHFIFSSGSGHTKMRSSMLKRILQSADEDLKHNILCYVGPHAENVIHTSNEVPEKIQNLVSTLTAS